MFTKLKDFFKKYDVSIFRKAKKNNILKDEYVFYNRYEYEHDFFKPQEIKDFGYNDESELISDIKLAFRLKHSCPKVRNKAKIAVLLKHKDLDCLDSLYHECLLRLASFIILPKQFAEYLDTIRDKYDLYKYHSEVNSDYQFHAVYADDFYRMLEIYQKNGAI